MPYWIADLCSNWNGDIDRACEIVEAAADAGFDAVKVQAINGRAMWRDGDPRIEKHKHLELDPDEIGELHDLATICGLDFGVSVFAPEDVREIAHRCDYLKIAGCESMWTPLIQAVVDSGQEWMISTPPGWTPPVGIAGPAVGDMLVARLHCVPSYPCPVSHANLTCIDAIRNEGGWWTGAGVGYSDHTSNLTVVTEAATWYSAEFIELHFDLEDMAGAAERAHSWTPQQFELLLDCVADSMCCSGRHEDAQREHCSNFWANVARDLDGYRR